VNAAAHLGDTKSAMCAEQRVVIAEFGEPTHVNRNDDGFFSLAPLRIEFDFSHNFSNKLLGGTTASSAYVADDGRGRIRVNHSSAFDEDGNRVWGCVSIQLLEHISSMSRP